MKPLTYKSLSGISGAVFGFAAAAAFAWSSAALFKPFLPAASVSPLDSEIEALGSRFHFRPVLRGKPAQGNAARFYGQAASAMLTGGSDLTESLMNLDDLDPADFEVIAHVNREALAKMSRGAAQAGSLLDLDFREGMGARSIQAGRALEIAAAAAAEALLLRRDGKTTEARRLLADAAMFGRDLARGGGLVHRALGCRAEFLALRWLAIMAAVDAMRGMDLRELLREIAVLDASEHPVVETALAEAALAMGEARSLPPPLRDFEFAGLLAFVGRARIEWQSGGLDIAGIGRIARGIPGCSLLSQAADFAAAASDAESCTARLRAAVRAMVVVRMAGFITGSAPETLESAYAAIGEPFDAGSGLQFEPRRLVLRSDNSAGPGSAAAPCAFGSTDSAWEWKMEAMER